MAINRVNTNSLYLVQLCKVNPNKGYVNGKELYEMCKQFGFIVDTSKLNGTPIIETEEIIVRRPYIFSNPKEVREYLTGVRLDYASVERDYIDGIPTYKLSSKQNEFDLFVLKEYHDTNPIPDDIVEYSEKHKDIKAYKSYLEELKKNFLEIHQKIKEQEIVKQMIKTHSDNYKK